MVDVTNEELFSIILQIEETLDECRLDLRAIVYEARRCNTEVARFQAMHALTDRDS